MKLGTIVELLSSVPLFSGLSTRQLATISTHGELEIFSPGDVIIEEGRRGDAGFLIITGTVKRTEGLFADEGPRIFGPGTFIGEMAMLVECDYSSTITAEASVQAVKFVRPALRQLMESDALVAEHFRSKVADRFVDFVDALRAFRKNLGIADPGFTANDGLAEELRSVRAS